jgi:(R,R)-butanediol dehydrogenase / meso-butanediol dehydrogenase / diacetyl reductase
MKALRWYAKEDLRYEDVPEPFPGPGQVKAKIILAGICGSDLREYVDGPHVISPDRVPVITGHEFIGRVVELGKGTTEFDIGDRVTGLSCWFCGECFFCKKGRYNLCTKIQLIGASTNGCMAEYLIAPGRIYYKVPDSIPDEIGALVEPLSVSLHAIHRGNVRLGSTVAIVGDGTIGLCALMAAKAAGASEVFVVSKHKNRGKMAASMGATCVINIGNEDPISRIKELTSGLGAEISIDCVGYTDTLKLSVDLTRSGGTVVLIGASDIPNAINFNNILINEITVKGSITYIQEAEEVIALLADGRIQPGHLITDIVPFEDALEKGLKMILSNKEDTLKVLLKIS